MFTQASWLDSLCLLIRVSSFRCGEDTFHRRDLFPAFREKERGVRVSSVGHFFLFKKHLFLAASGLSCTGFSVVEACGFSCPAACGI